MSNQDFRLTIELVPRTVWFSSLRQIYEDEGQSSKWKKLKSKLFEEEGRRCWICGEEGERLEAHEFWGYDDENHIQRLVAVHHLCAMCHRVKHIGFWCYIERGKEQLAKLGLTREDLIDHFCRINGCTREEFEKYEEECFRIWRERSKFEWEQDLDKYDPDRVT